MKKSVFRIRIQSGQWLRIRVHQGGKMTHKIRNRSRNFMFWSAEGFICSLEILYGGQGIGKLLFLIQNFTSKFFPIFVTKTLDPHWIRISIQPHEYGYETLVHKTPLLLGSMDGMRQKEVTTVDTHSELRLPRLTWSTMPVSEFLRKVEASRLL